MMFIHIRSLVDPDRLTAGAFSLFNPSAPSSGKESFVSNRSKFAVIAALAVLTIFAVAACGDDTASPFSTTTPVPIADSSAPEGDAIVAGPDVENGRKKFASLGCSGCHSTGANKVVGPGLAGIGSKGDDYIRTSIVDPGAVIVDGYANLMPTGFDALKESDLEDLIAYLSGLE